MKLSFCDGEGGLPCLDGGGEISVVFGATGRDGSTVSDDAELRSSAG